MKHFEDIKDDEIRIISRQEVKRKPLYRRWWFWAAIAAALVSLAVILALSIRHQATQPADVEETAVESAPLSPTMEQTGTARVMVRDTAINDVPLRLQTRNSNSASPTPPTRHWYSHSRPPTSAPTTTKSWGRMS